MSQGIFSNIVPSTTSGNALAILLNSFKDAVVSGFSGTSRPSELQAAGYWIDTTNDPTTWDYKFYTGVSDITVFTINLTTGVASISSADSLFQIAKISADSVGPIIRLLKKRVSGGGQVLTGDTVGEIQFYGTRDSGVTTLQSRIRSLSTDNVTASVQGAYLVFEATTQGAASLSEAMRIIDAKMGVGIADPTNTLHVYGSGVKSEYSADDAVGAKVIVKKKRASGVGQVLNNDVISQINSVSVDEAGADIASAQIEVSARELQTSTAQGSKVVIRNKKIGQTAYTDQITIAESVTVNTDLEITGNLTVQGTTTTLNTATLDVEDSNISVNKNGTQAAANAAKSGIKVEMSDATHAQIGYESSATSKFVVGEVGTESEIATIGHSQILTNKTLTSPVLNSPSISTPSKLEVKQATEATLTTYALTATNGQWCFATDTKVMYQVIDTALVPAGSGGGGTTLAWNDSGAAPITEFVDGFKLESFDSISSQELYAVLSVPSSYRVGKPINLTSGKFFCTSTTNKVFFKTTTALINSSTVLGTYTNTHNSTNTEVTVNAVSNTITGTGTLALTGATGLINAVAVQPGDKLRIRLFRDNAAESISAAADAKLIIDSFEPTFS